jgi:hypothetical protein
MNMGNRTARHHRLSSLLLLVALSFSACGKQIVGWKSERTADESICCVKPGAAAMDELRRRKALLIDGGSIEDATLPDVSLPDVSLPDVSLPDMQLPDMQLPDMQLPDMQLPDMQLPDLQLPDMPLPDMPSYDTHSEYEGGTG